jgi:hypothetical protein
MKSYLKLGLAMLVAFLLGGPALAAGPYPDGWPYTPITTPNGSSLPWTVKDGVKEFHLTVEEVEYFMAPGTRIKAWGYNGSTPGPTIEVVQGDRVRIFVENRLPEPTSVHFHGVLLPSGMDGITGMSQPAIQPGETFVYEFTIHQAPATLMYHSHGDEMVQIGLGTMGFFIIHPRDPSFERVDRDFAIFLNEWKVPPGSQRPNPNEMTDFNLFTFNSRVFPATEPLIARTGQRVRFRFANVGQELHPIHVHGHQWTITGTDGGPVPPSARIPDTTVLVNPGQTRDVIIEKVVAGDWAFHCHRRHHPMNAMEHDVPNLLGVDQSGLEEKIKELVPGYMAMGETGMAQHAQHAKHMDMPENTEPMMSGDGPYGSIGMGGMFTILKVRDHLKAYTDKEAGWYKAPAGTVAHRVGPAAPSQGKVYACPMHPEVRSASPGNCPKCGMRLEELKPAPAVYSCPMHPEVTSDRPGSCPQCGMPLQKVPR